MSEEPDQAPEELTPQEASERAAAGAQLIDVRSDHEWEAGRIAGATHIVFDEVGERAGDIDPERPVILYCRGGNRSAAAAAVLRSAGYDAVHVEGGLTAWTEAGLPLEPEDGYVAESGEAAAVLEARRRGGAGQG
jgi:rhodanese-related sulfurtransferase